MDIKYPVPCPLMGAEIAEEICFDIHCVVDGGTPERFAPKKARETPNYKQICKNCPYHRDD
ncbi:hypothetical protein [Hominenteromicrobium sp.]|uniref:hypothetical protein n=1 Tax=Hominenteromicrobium sp. TaxID=3073581 RepID=UPI003A955010